MLCVIPYCSSDVRQTHTLLTWLGDLGGCKEHDCLLVADAAVPWDQGKKSRDLALPSFKSVACISNGSSVKGWIPGSCSLFKAAAVCSAGQPFFWLEPDAVPLRASWLDEIEAAYVSGGKPFMGAFVTHHEAGWPNPYMEGCAVYPEDCWERFKNLWNANVSWTKWSSQISVPNGFNTPLIQQLWGEAGKPPTFAAKSIPGTNVFCLAQIKPEACLFHRNKDGSLIRLLRQAQGIAAPSQSLLVVFPFCERDARMFAKTVEWMAELNPHYPNDALLSYEITTTPGAVKLMRDAVSRCFENIYHTTYDRPKNGDWPPTIAFIHAANYAQRFNKSWLWMEFDAIPVKPEWLSTLEQLYHEGGKPFAGPIVPNLMHVNGTSIYPPNTPEMLAEAFRHTKTAWDVAAKNEMAGKTTNLMPVYYHTWGVHQGKLHPFLGPAPDFRNDSLFRQIPTESVIVHRSKDGHLIDRLRYANHVPV